MTKQKLFCNFFVAGYLLFPFYLNFKLKALKALLLYIQYMLSETFLYIWNFIIRNLMSFRSKYKSLISLISRFPFKFILITIFRRNFYSPIITKRIYNIKFNFFFSFLIKVLWNMHVHNAHHVPEVYLDMHYEKPI